MGVIGDLPYKPRHSVPLKEIQVVKQRKRLITLKSETDFWVSWQPKKLSSLLNRGVCLTKVHNWSKNEFFLVKFIVNFNILPKNCAKDLNNLRKEDRIDV